MIADAKNMMGRKVPGININMVKILSLPINKVFPPDLFLVLASLVVNAIRLGFVFI